MPIYQSMIFQNCGAAGWTNVYYISASDGAAALATLDSINTAQLKLQNKGVLSINLRVSDVTIKGDGFDKVPATIPGSRGLDITTVYDLDAVLELHLRTADGLHRVNHFIHGLDNTDVQGNADGTKSPAAPFLANADVIAFPATVKTASVNWQKRSIPPVTAPLTDGGYGAFLGTRRAGRPFGLFRGRRRTA